MPKKRNRKKPSRARYEESHPVFSTRVDRKTFDELIDHLKTAGCSRADFLKDSLGREKSMLKERVEMLARKELDPSLKERVEALEEERCLSPTWEGKSPGESP